MYLQMFYEFFKTGFFAIGGGLATLPFLQVMGTKFGWFTQSQLADMIAVSESTPGPIGVNMSTYAGFINGGILGAIIATIGLITPSIIIILLIARLLKNFKDNKYVKSLFYGLRPASTGLILAAGLGVASMTFVKENKLNLISISFAIILLVLTNFVPKIKSWHPIVFILISAFFGIVINI